MRMHEKINESKELDEVSPTSLKTAAGLKKTAAKTSTQPSASTSPAVTSQTPRIQKVDKLINIVKNLPQQQKAQIRQALGTQE